MKLQDFLKVKKVRCVVGDQTIKASKVYDVIGLDETFIHVIDDNGEEAHYWYSRFEPVLDSAENPLQNIELTPEFEAVEPKFKVGDKIYFGTNPDIKTISEVGNDNDVQFIAELGWASGYSCCHATQENYERLQATFTDIEFEQPPKPLTGNELCRKLLDKGEKYIMAKDDTDTWRIICDYCDDWFTDVVTGKCLKNVTPVNSKGEPLTEAVLDE